MAQRIVWLRPGGNTLSAKHRGCSAEIWRDSFADAPVFVGVISYHGVPERTISGVGTVAAMQAAEKAMKSICKLRRRRRR